MATGVGYHLCRDVCHQDDHAEVDVLKKAKENAKGGHLTLNGHTYCCDNCISNMKEYGVSSYSIIDNDGEVIKRYKLVEENYVLEFEQ
jgi:hypothetical protein